MIVCLYGSSSNKINEKFKEEAYKLGELIAQNGHTLLYGGGNNGVMGACARGAEKYHGQIIGITPDFFNVDGELFQNCSEMIYTKNISERKMMFEEKADMFVIGPGGIGTYDEFFEVLTLRHLHRHNKPIAILNVNNCYNHLIDFINEANQQFFVDDETLSLFSVHEDSYDLCDKYGLMKNKKEQIY